jgi:serine/threonine protein kinase
MRFRFGKQIGSGGFGIVRKTAEIKSDKRTGRTDLAAKFLSEDMVEDEEAHSRFIREVRLLDDDLGHENIIEVVGRNLSASPPWFVMPLAEANLEQAMEEGSWGNSEWVVEIFAQILEGMAHAHDREIPILHRDLKPKNILLCDGVPKISDFGLGKRMDPNSTGLTKTAMWMGTEPYMAPEQFQDAKRVGPEADVYALGKILCQMLTGKEPEVLYVDLDDVPKEFRFFIEKCCRRDPMSRYRNAAEAAAAFAIFTKGSEMLYPPLEEIERIIAEWTEAENAEDREELVRRLDELLIANGRDEELYFRMVPRIPEQLIDQYMDLSPEAFKTMLNTYDGHIVGGLPFSYCDVVADFYARLFKRSIDLELKRTLISRLIKMGPSHNRWYVGEVVASLLGEVSDLSTAMMIAEEVNEDPESAAWFWDPWVRAIRLERPLRDAFSEAT